MVGSSYDQKPYRRSMMKTWGATVHRSPSELTESGRAQASHPTGSLGIAISEAVEVAAQREDTNYALGSRAQPRAAAPDRDRPGGDRCSSSSRARFPDVIVGCVGGGSNFAGLVFPFIRGTLRGENQIRYVAAEPAACPTLTRGVYAYDFGDTVGLTPLMPMHTLGHDFVPPPLHAGGLRYHGAAPMISGLVKAGVVEARAYRQNETFDAAVRFARTEGIIPAPESAHAIRAAIVEAEAAKEAGEERTILFGLSGHGHFDLAAYDAYLAGTLEDPEFSEADLESALAALPAGHPFDRVTSAVLGRASGDPHSSALRDAALLGGVSGMRTFMAPAMLAVRGRLRRRRELRVLVAAAGELAGDKIPAIPDRIEPPALAGRVTGRDLGPHRGGDARRRRWPRASPSSPRPRASGCAPSWPTKVPDAALGAAEDALAIALAIAATRAPHPEPEAEPALSPLRGRRPRRAGGRGGHRRDDRRATAGADGVQRRTGEGRPQADPPSDRQARPAQASRHAQPGHALGVRHEWGLPYGMLAGRLPRAPNPLAGGAALGLGVWATSLVELPALGVAPLPWEQSPRALPPTPASTSSTGSRPRAAQHLGGLLR